MRSRLKILLSIFIPAIVISIFIILVVVFTTKKPFKTRFLVSKSEYNILNDNKFIHSQYIYEDSYNSILDKKGNIENIYLRDKSYEKEITLLDVVKNKSTMEKYNNQLFYKKTYVFDLGIFNDNLYLENPSIIFNLKNKNKYTFSIGKLSIMKVDNFNSDKRFLLKENKVLSYHEGSMAYIYRPNEIKLTYDLEENNKIENIYYSFDGSFKKIDFELVKEEKEKSIILKISKDDYFLLKVPLIIEFRDLSTSEIYRRNLSESEVFNGVFADQLLCRGDLVNEAVFSKNWRC